VVLVNQERKKNTIVFPHTFQAVAFCVFAIAIFVLLKPPWQDKTADEAMAHEE
jgi:hypothetical protein